MSGLFDLTEDMVPISDKFNCCSLTYGISGYAGWRRCGGCGSVWRAEKVSGPCPPEWLKAVAE